MPSDLDSSAGSLADTDARLMLRARDGGDDAFEQLVERYQRRLVGLMYHMVGDAQEAEDLAQEVFLRVHRSRDKYEPTAKFSTWMFTIANNLARNAIRDRKRKPSRARGDGAIATGGNDSGGQGVSGVRSGFDGLAVSPSGASPSRILAKSELAEVVRQAVAQLSEEQRMAVMLNKFEAMSYREIGEIMNKSEKAVKSLLARARVALKEILEPYIEDGTAVKEEG